MERDSVKSATSEEQKDEPLKPPKSLPPPVVEEQIDTCQGQQAVVRELSDFGSCESDDFFDQHLGDD